MDKLKTPELDASALAFADRGNQSSEEQCRSRDIRINICIGVDTRYVVDSYNEANEELRKTVSSRGTDGTIC